MEKAVNVSCVSYLDTFTGDSWTARCLERLLVTDGCMLSSRKRSAKQGEQGPSGSPCLWVTGLEVQPCPTVYSTNTRVTRLSCLPSPQQGLVSPGSRVPAHPVCSLGLLQLGEAALRFKVLCSCRAVMPWEGWESPACVLSPQQS